MKSRVTKQLILSGVMVLYVGGASCDEGQWESSRDETPWQRTWEDEIPFYPESGSGEQEPPQLTEQSTVTDYLTYAVRSNPELQAAYHRWAAVLAQVDEAKTLPDPKLTYAYYIEQVETRVGPQRQKVGLSQTLPLFGKLGLRFDTAHEGAEAEHARYAALRRGLFYRVQNAYYEYYYLARAIAITEENIDLVTDLETVARAKYRAGTLPQADLIKAQVELGELENRLRSLRDLERPVLARFNATLNRSSDAPLPRPKEIPEVNVDLSDEEVFTWLRERNPELWAINHHAAKEKAASILARKERYPDITLGVEYIDTGDALMRGVDDSGKDPVVAMVSITVPFWQTRYKAIERAADSRYAAALEERTARENDLVAGLEMALYNFRDAERKIGLYRDALIPKAEQSLEVSQQAFAAGELDFLDLIEAERTLLEFRLSYERALADRAQRLAEIEMLVGAGIPRSHKQTPEPTGSEEGTQ
jgi:cobalt-zinc-cadmium efflux system outer membrane protein